MRNATAIAVTTLALLLVGCNREEPDPLPDPIETGAPVEIPASPTTPVDPEAETGFTAGTATVTVTGSVNLSETYPALGLPASWVPPPGDFAMTWIGPGDRELTLGGISFTAQQPTSAERVLTFALRSVDGPIEFVSDDGGCLVTISPALPDQMGGTFLCTAIQGAVEGGPIVTVMARGTFTAA